MQSHPPHTAPSGRRRWLAALLGAGMALCAGLTQAAEPTTVRIGFQKAGLLAVLKAQGALDKPLGDLGYKVEWKEFPAGPQLLEALNTGSIEFGYTGAPPAVFAQAAGAGRRRTTCLCGGRAGRQDQRGAVRARQLTRAQRG